MFGLPPFRMLAPIDDCPYRGKLQAVATCHFSEVRILLEDATVAPPADRAQAVSLDHGRRIAIKAKNTTDIGVERGSVLNRPVQPLS